MLNFKNKTEPPITELDFIDDGYDIETLLKFNHKVELNSKKGILEQVVVIQLL